VIKNLKSASGVAYKNVGRHFPSLVAPNPAPKIDSLTPVVLGFRGRWSLSGGMENSKNSDSMSLYSIGKNVGSAGDHELSSVRCSALTPNMGTPGELIGGRDDTRRDTTSGLWFVLLDEAADFRQLGNGGSRPNYLHVGGGSSFSVPQERSQRRTSS
jgi:hypothetical protein